MTLISIQACFGEIVSSVGMTLARLPCTVSDKSKLLQAPVPDNAASLMRLSLNAKRSLDDLLSSSFQGLF